MHKYMEIRSILKYMYCSRILASYMYIRRCGGAEVQRCRGAGPQTERCGVAGWPTASPWSKSKRKSKSKPRGSEPDWVLPRQAWQVD